MINLNRPTCDDDAIVRQSRIVAFDANARAERAKANACEPADWDAKRGFERSNHAGPGGLVVPLMSHDSGGYCGFFTQRAAEEGAKLADAAPVAQLAAADSAASGAALVGTKPQSNAETWHTEAPTVAGVYIAQDTPVDANRTYYMRFHGSEGWGAHHDTAEDAAEEEEGWGESRPIVWLRLVRPDHPAAKPAALPGWRRGPDVPESERKSGLWFCRVAGDASTVWGPVEAHTRRWDRECEYRPAPPGVKECEAYSPALYGEEA
jgi:hypothetical protein